MTGSSEATITVLVVDGGGRGRERAATRIPVDDSSMTVESVGSVDAALTAVTDAEFDCLVSRYRLPDGTGLDLLESVREADRFLPFVLFAKEGNERVASDAISLGVSEYVDGSQTDRYAALTDRIEAAVADHRTEQSLRESEQRYRTLVEGSHDGIYIYRDDQFRFVNERTCEITGYDRETLLGMSIWDLLHPEDRDRVREIGRKRRNGGDAPNTYGARVVTAEGETRYLEFSVQSTTYQGEWAALGSVRDVTDKRERERELAQYRTIIETVGDPVYTLDPDGRIALVNHALAEITGYEESELLGEHVSILMRDEDVATAQRLIEDLLKTDDRRTGTFEMEAITKAGDHIPCEDHVTLLPGPQEFNGTAGVVRDISDRKERERTLRRQNERLDQFASVVSHDLRNPLSVIVGRLEAARETGNDEHFAAIERSTRRMERLIDDLLTLARDGRRVGEVDPVSLDAVVDRSWGTVETGAANLDVDGDLGVVPADGDRLPSLFENLFRNAIEHGPTDTWNAPRSGDAVEHDGGDEVTVRVGRIDSDETTGFYVADDGEGFTHDEYDRVFDHGYTTATDGTGLGLAIVEGIVEAHGWTIDATESRDGGARFEVTDVSWPT
ncbi:PAS domain S-box protein [Halorientalis marina]|uniref:PAS domain S-box protein n=1 Tax=Halorientalis marina TaxID=2931976 RepID=UPI001FF6C561|nr:PAS domain S-box protein [Halorientalis marina]